MSGERSSDVPSEPRGSRGGGSGREGPDRLWAPWRIAYFTEPQPQACVFCHLPALPAEQDEQTFILARLPHVFIVLNRYPYNNGHLMVVPYNHTADLLELTGPEREEMLTAAGWAVQALQEAMRAQGCNIGLNLGRAAGAGITEHLHLHVVPRWIGDTNFMPVLGDTKVLSESLAGTWTRLKPAFDRILSQESR